MTYGDPGKTKPVREKVVTSGYAVGFQSVLDYIESQAPSQEHIEHGLRVEKTAYPADAIRESLGNALIHQDFLMSGVGPMVDIFPDRIEITNPGEPLVDVRRFLDAPPRSRNESLAALMRRMRICEERGTGSTRSSRRRRMRCCPRPTFRLSRVTPARSSTALARSGK